MPTSFPNAESKAVKPLKISNPMHVPMLNPRNYPVSCRQMLLGLAGLPWTLSLMQMSRTAEQGTLLVLCYHRITESVSAGGFCDSHYFITLPKRVFLSQIRWLTRHYRVVDLDEVLSGRPLPPKAALITFDDGFRDVAETAFPILRSFGLPATVFLIGSVIRKTRSPGSPVFTGCSTMHGRRMRTRAVWISLESKPETATTARAEYPECLRRSRRF